MEISVIIPTYKPKDYIWECLTSLINQSFAKDKFEIIIVLNGCSTPWKNEIETFIKYNMSNMNVVFLHTEVSGVSNARNIALDVARGKYVTFLDDDDYISEKYLQRMYEVSRLDTIVLSNTIAFKDGSKYDSIPYQLTDVYKEYSNHKSINLNSKVRKYFSGPCMKLIPMNFIHGRRFNVKFKNGEDSLFMFLISDMIHRLVFTSSDAIYYRRYRQGSAVMKQRSKRDRIINNFNCILEYTRIYLKGGYSHYFFLSRIAAEFRCAINAILKNM